MNIFLCVSILSLSGHANADLRKSPGVPASPTEKSYPDDKRPKVDVLHFKHPYPVVQDSDDFDADYVKDENSDDGSWKAQTEYDRLRHKLAKEKADVAKSLAAKAKAEQHLKDALRRRKEQVRAATTTAPPKQGSIVGDAGLEHAKKAFKKEVASRTPGGIASPGDVRVATSDTQEAMEHLQDCKKQLEEARERLKKVVEELKEAKKVQQEKQADLGAALGNEQEEVREKKRQDTSVSTQYKEYMDAREEYLKQQAKLSKMEADIQVAAEKIKAIRDGEDNSGGVYNSGDKNDGLFGHHRSAAPYPVSQLLAFIVALTATVIGSSL